MTYSKAKIALVIASLLVLTFSVACPTGANLIPNCATCVTSGSSTVCSTCLNSYYLASNTCVLCSTVLANCAYCALNSASQPTCQLCATNYGLIGANCQNCSAISGCSTCQITSNNLQCTKCNSNLVLYNAMSTCVPCQITYCSNCTISNDGIFTCFACSTGYFLKNSTNCLSCALSITYCANCLFDQNNKLICAVCANTNLYIYNNTCVANCTKGGLTTCSICQMISVASNTMICTSCLSNYYLDISIKNCLPCSQSVPGCNACSTSNPDPITNATTVSCSECASGYYLEINSFTCIICSSVKANCQTCSYNFASNTGQCTNCKSGYYLNSTDLICYSCSSTPFAIPSFANNSCSICSMVNLTTMICTTCMNNYYLSGTICLSCTSAISYCQFCSFNSTLKCTSCLNGYLINALSVCQLCSQLYPHCKYCNSIECTDCIDGYYTIDNKNCLLNCIVSNCQKCMSKANTICTICNTGYQLSTNNSNTCVIIACNSPLQFNGLACVCPFTQYYSTSTGQCTNCNDPNCLICPSNKCSQCLPGYYNGTTCLKCIINCQSCSSPYDCLMCLDGYYYYNGACHANSNIIWGQTGIYYSQNLYQLCGVGCKQCTSNTVCTSCTFGFFLNKSSCLQCSQNCKICNSTFDNSTNTSSLICISCYSGNALLNSACKACTDTNCIRCDFNIYFCLQCSVTYTADSSGLCKLCASNCDFCDSSGPGTCDQLSCSLGYTRVNSTNCLKCLSGCVSCNTVYPFQCLGCLIGTFNNTNGICQNCPSNCTACTQLSKCTSCKLYFNLTNGICTQICHLPCIDCTYQNDLQLCTTCILGYGLVNSTCIPDFSCITTNICEYCPLQYFPYRGNCYQCVSNCDSCTLNNTDPAFTIVGLNYYPYVLCANCHEGYYLTTIFTCSSCSTGCLLCQSSSLCLKCNDGYFLQYNAFNGQSSATYNVGICRKCALQCLACDLSPNRCISCRSNYYLNNFICYSLTNVTFTFVLTASTNTSQTTMFNNIVSKFKDIYNQIASALGPTIVGNPYLLIINNITQGSVIIQGNAGFDSTNSDSSAVYSSMSDSAQQTTTIGGNTVTSYTLQPQGFTPSSSTATSATNYVIYIIIGACVLAVVIILVIVCLCMKYKRKNKNTNQVDKVETEQQEPATSKGMLKSEDYVQKHSKRESPKKQKNSKSVGKRKQVSHISNNYSEHSSDQEQKKQKKSRSPKLSRASKKVDGPQKRRSKKQFPDEDDQNDQYVKDQFVRREDNVSYRQKSKANRSLQKKSNVSKTVDKKKKNQQRPKTSHLIEQASSEEQEQQKYKSAKVIGDEHSKSIKHYERQSFREQKRKAKQVQQLQNDSHYSDQKTQKKQRMESKKSDPSISRKYIPNSNTHFI